MAEVPPVVVPVLAQAVVAEVKKLSLGPNDVLWVKVPAELADDLDALEEIDSAIRWAVTREEDDIADVPLCVSPWDATVVGFQDSPTFANWVRSLIHDELHQSLPSLDARITREKAD